MDAYEAMKVIFARVQSLVADLDMASRAMGTLLNQDIPHADMIRLARSPDDELISLVTDLAFPDANNKLALSPYSLYPSSTWVVATGARGDDYVGASCSPASGGGHGHRGSFSLSNARGSGRRLIRPCVYFARKSCKKGGTCRFVHVVPYDCAPAAARPQMAVAFSPPPSLEGLDYLVRQQHHRQQGESSSQRSSVAAPSMLLPSAADDNVQMQQHGPSPLRFRSPSALDNDTINHDELQIYITFPASSTFTEDEVAAYFSGFGPVQEVRIPRQAKRMFGFVAFVYPESVRLVLAKGNSHLVCGSRVLVKPYKEKKTSNKQQLLTPLIRSQQHDISHLLRARNRAVGNPQTGHERMTMYMPGSGHDAAAAAVLRKKMEEKEAAELQEAIELQNRHFMGMQLLHSNNNDSNRLSSGLAMGASAAGAVAAGWKQEQQYEEKEQDNNGHGSPNQQLTVNSGARQAVAPNVVWEDSDLELNLPENPFYSPTKASIAAAEPSTPAASLKCPGSSLGMDQLD